MGTTKKEKKAKRLNMMNSRKFVLMAIAVVAIGLFALPSSISLFSGQHTRYDLSESVGGTSGVNNVPCEKCHAEIAEEMVHGDNGVHRDLTCAMCHRAPFTGYTYARGGYSVGSGGYPPTPGQEAHAASTVECMDCHDGAGDKGTDHWLDREYSGKCGNCHQGGYDKCFIGAGGFGLTPCTGDTGEKAAHKKFVLDANESTLMDGANEACIACHTRIGVNLTWTKMENLDFTATEDSEGVWTIPGFAASGENVTQVNSPNEWTS